jgi:hypothetical protein
MAQYNGAAKTAASPKMPTDPVMPKNTDGGAFTVTNETSADPSGLNYAIAQVNAATSGAFVIDLANTIDDSVALAAIDLHSGVSLTSTDRTAKAAPTPWTAAAPTRACSSNPAR